jgi:uncharacterized membrane protein YgcG
MNYKCIRFFDTKSKVYWYGTEITSEEYDKLSLYEKTKFVPIEESVQSTRSEETSENFTLPFADYTTASTPDPDVPSYDFGSSSDSSSSNDFGGGDFGGGGSSDNY